MYLDVSANPTVTVVSSETTLAMSPCAARSLAISNDGKQVVVSDDVSATPQVYIYNASARRRQAVTDLVLPAPGARPARIRSLQPLSRSISRRSSS